MAPKVGPMRGEPAKKQVAAQSDWCAQDVTVPGIQVKTFACCEAHVMYVCMCKKKHWQLHQASQSCFFTHQPPQPPPCRTQSCQAQSHASGPQSHPQLQGRANHREPCSLDAWSGHNNADPKISVAHHLPVFMSSAPMPGACSIMPRRARRLTPAAPMGPSWPQEDTMTCGNHRGGAWAWLRGVH